MGGWWPYSCGFVGCCPQDLFEIARILIWEKPKHVGLERMLVFVQKFCNVYFLLTCDKKTALSHLVCEMVNIFCMTCLIRNLQHSHVHSYWPAWLAWVVFNHCLDLFGDIQEFLSYQNDQNKFSGVLYLRNHYWTHPTLFKHSALSSDEHLNTLRSSYWSFQYECQAV